MEEDEAVTLLLLQLGIALCPGIKPLRYWKSRNNIIETGEDIDGCLKEMQYNCSANSSSRLKDVLDIAPGFHLEAVVTLHNETNSGE